MKKLFALILSLSMVLLCAACGSQESAEAASDNTGKYSYSLTLEEQPVVDSVTFDEMVTITVAPSARDGGPDTRSTITFSKCAFQNGVTVIGDYNAMIILEDCTFGADSVVTVQEVTAGNAKTMTLDDSYVKLLTTSEGLTVQTESAVGILSTGPDFVINGETFSKEALAPDIAYLGVYTVYENNSMEYAKLALGDDDSVVVIE